MAVLRINIYGVIRSADQAKDKNSVTSEDILARLAAAENIDGIELHIFSQGGEVDAGLAIYSALKQRPERIAAYVEGIAASIATIIMCAADCVYIADSARLMIHNPYVPAAFGIRADDARHIADEVDKNSTAMMKIYAKKTGRPENEIKTVMDGKSGFGTWLTADEAIKAGFADKLTPEAKKPRELAACISPGIFRWQGCTMDLRQYPEAAAQVSLIINSRKSQGADKMGFFNKKKPVKAVLTDMVCPHCNAAAKLDAKSGAVSLTDDKGNLLDDAETMEAKRMKGNTRSELFTVTCPACGEEYAWDTEASEKKPPVAKSAKERRSASKTYAKAAKTRKPARRPAAELLSADCPECGESFDYETDEVEAAEDEDGTTGCNLICPACETVFFEPSADIEDSQDDSVPTEESSAEAYRKGVLAERRRIAGLDEMQGAVPGLEPMIAAAKRSGTSIQTMSGNVLRAMAGNNPLVNGQRQLGAINRDAENSGINSLGVPARFNKKAEFVTAVNKNLEDR